MPLTAYTHYRLYVTKTSTSLAGAPAYTTVNEFRGFNAFDGSGTNLLTGGTQTASDTYNTQVASNAFDNNASTFWESNNTVAAFRWLKIVLGAPVTIRNFYLSSTSYPNEVPQNFLIQGSNDDIVWDTLVDMTNWVTSAVANTGNMRADLIVSGVSKISASEGSTRVLVHRWSDGVFLASRTPHPTTGVWSYKTQTTDTLLVTHIGPSGYRPQADGPISPTAE